MSQPAAALDKFFTSEKFAIAGASKDPAKFGNKVSESLGKSHKSCPTEETDRYESNARWR